MNARIARSVLICMCASWAALAMWLPLRAQVEPSDPQSAPAPRAQVEKSVPQSAPAPRAQVEKSVPQSAPAPRAQDAQTRRAQVELAPASVVEPVAAQAVGVYFRRTCRIVVAGGPVVLRSSQPDGVLRTDDAVHIDVARPDGEHRTWEHDFRSAATGAIAALAPRRIDMLFGRGVHTVTIELIDLRSPRYSSVDYVLLYATWPNAAIRM